MSELQNSQNRIEWVDIGKYICIMFVMLSHLESNTTLLSTFYSPFFLTVFFFLAGYVHKQTPTFKEHFIKKIKGLFVPWFIFSNFNILLSALITLKGERNTSSEILWNLLQIRGKSDGIWFVAALFVSFIPFYFFIKLDRPKFCIVIACALSVISLAYVNIMDPNLLPWGSANLPWHLEYMFQAMLWMVLGYYFRLHGEATFDKINNFARRICLWCAYLVAAFAPADMFGGGTTMFASYIRSVVGIAAIVALSKSFRTNKYIAFVGANTLTYFALHGKVYTVIEAVLGKFTIYHSSLENTLTSSVIAIAITCMLSVILIIPAMIINRWFPWVLGRKRC